MKYLLVLVAVIVGLWMVSKRLRGPVEPKPPRRGAPGDRRVPAEMVECAHCGVHLPAAEAVAEGRHVYCGEAHRRLGPREASK